MNDVALNIKTFAMTCNHCFFCWCVDEIRLFGNFKWNKVPSCQPKVQIFKLPPCEAARWGTHHFENVDDKSEPLQSPIILSIILQSTYLQSTYFQSTYPHTMALLPNNIFALKRLRDSKVFLASQSKCNFCLVRKQKMANKEFLCLASWLPSSPQTVLRRNCVEF